MTRKIKVARNIFNVCPWKSFRGIVLDIELKKIFHFKSLFIKSNPYNLFEQVEFIETYLN